MSGTLSISSQTAKVLFYLGLTHSFSSFLFVKWLAKSPEPLDFDLLVANPLGGSVIADVSIKDSLIFVEDRRPDSSGHTELQRDFRHGLVGGVSCCS